MSMLNNSFTGFNQKTGKWNNPSQIFRYIVAYNDENFIDIKLPFEDKKELSDFYRKLLNTYSFIEFRFYVDLFEIEDMRQNLKGRI